MTFTPESFDPDKYKKSGWKVQYRRMSYDPTECRLIVHFVAGRQYSILFTVIPDLSLGNADPALREVEQSLYYYTFSLVDRFVAELEDMLSDLYGETIKLSREYR